MTQAGEKGGWDGVERRRNVDTGGWDGVERRAEPVAELVERAAEIAAQRVARLHRRRLVLQAFLAALTAAAAISLPVALITNSQRAATARANARFNCATQQEVLDVFNGFLRSDAHLRYVQQHYQQRARVLAAFSKAIGDPKLLGEIQARSDAADVRTRRYWTHRLIPRLKRLTVNCNSRIK